MIKLENQTVFQCSYCSRISKKPRKNLTTCDYGQYIRLRAIRAVLTEAAYMYGDNTAIRDAIRQIDKDTDIRNF